MNDDWGNNIKKSLKVRRFKEIILINQRLNYNNPLKKSKNFNQSLDYTQVIFNLIKLNFFLRFNIEQTMSRVNTRLLI
jgi:hypothetical protein